ncbi:M50 family metallopeptidase [Spongisporangium articulatum]|uniref:M50 family metallopeptidase n=1 Tax=Spongisporangium articulatum TaxID=3362603 RepID=A0ABW8AMU2_9ACTN
MAYLVGVLVFVVGIALSIALHEIGHLAPAKRFGVKCTQYMIGFGPTLWSTRRGETEYGVKAIPLGGYVRMVGMFPPQPGKRARADTTGRFGLLIEQARHDSAQEIGDELPERLFYTKPVWQKLVVMLGGPTMNLVIAVVLLTVWLCGIGLTAQTTTLKSVSQCILPVSAPADATCGADSRPAPAAQAGLKPGDTITSINGVRTTSWSQMQKAIRSGAGQPLTLGIERAGQALTIRATPQLDARNQLDADGNPVLDADGNPVLTKVGFLGVTPASTYQRQSVTDVPGVVWDGLTATAGVVLQIPSKMVGVVQSIGGGERDPNGPISVVGVGRLAGEVTSSSDTTTTDMVVQLLSLLVSLNMALFVFNLIPLLPLDGGHVAGALWEGVRRRWAQARGAADPGPVDVARALPLAYGVACVLLGFSAVLIFADVVNPVRLGG